MYTEEPNRTINWGNVLRKIIIAIIIVLIIFLIIWLFNRSNQKSNKVNVNYDGNNTSIKSNNNNNNNNNNINNNSGLTNPNAYSESFITNYTYFHDTARDFVEQNNLPIENNSVKYTLQELINKKVLLPASYGNSTCDTEASYVIVTNSNGKYSMTTTLICGNEIAKTEEELKCSGLCANGSCNQEEINEDIDGKDKDYNYKIEYEFKQAYAAQETVYNCPAGYTKIGSGDATKCVKSNNNIVNPTKNTTYNCPAGYTKIGSGENTKCTIGSSRTVKATMTISYSCNTGYTLNGTKCVKTGTDTIDPIATTTYSCDNGATPTSDHKCPVTTTTYKCENGATPTSDHKCPVTTTTYKCDNGNLVNTKYCRIYTTGTYYIYHNIPYSTYNGCTYSGAVPENCPTCPNKVRTVYAYKCTSSTYKDYDATSVNNTTYTSATPVTSTTYTSAKSKINYSCADGYLLNSSNKCVKATTEVVNAISRTTYYCTTGKLSGINCIIDNNTTINPTKYVSYNCPNGYTKNGLGEASICTIGTTSTVNPTKTTSNVTKYRTKWSPETSIAGWTRTGRTRTV